VRAVDEDRVRASELLVRRRVEGQRERPDVLVRDELLAPGAEEVVEQGDDLDGGRHLAGRLPRA
jgi:hypothetical protein